MIEHGVRDVVHSDAYAIFASLSQAKTSDNRDCDNRSAVTNRHMEKSPKISPEAEDVFRRLDATGVKQRKLAVALGIDDDKISKVRNGTRQFQAAELVKALAWLDQIEGNAGVGETADLPPVDDDQLAYVSVEILPTYAGAGGGGNGDGDRSRALLPRSLIVDELRGRATDFLLINIRGDSMEPDFRHGDQVLVDKRDRSPAQPGPFAIWDGEWGEYVVKNVERIGGGMLRMFSSNDKYTPVEIVHEETRIIGRPVFYGRRL
jgi:phage repressor protein C with HTH and peptisase S24 domain